MTTFEKDQVIYDAGDENQTFFFPQKGFVKVGSITEDGHELIYDVRKGGDIVGELCASGQPRQDRAVALERTEVIAASRRESRNRADEQTSVAGSNWMKAVTARILGTVAEV